MPIEVADNNCMDFLGYSGVCPGMNLFGNPAGSRRPDLVVWYDSIEHEPEER